MTREDKQLLITDLCARLPYGVKVMTPDIDRGNAHKFESGIFTLHEINIYGLIEIFEEEIGVISIEDIKPILFPLSVAKNQGIEVNGEKILLKKWEIRTIEEHGYHQFQVQSFTSFEDSYPLLDLLNRYHIDYRGLIDKGLAISVFDLHENPYK